MAACTRAFDKTDSTDAGVLLDVVCVVSEAGMATSPTPDRRSRRVAAPGDTLIGIAARLLAAQADWRVVQRLNRIAQPRRLQIGQVLRIPLGLLAELVAGDGVVTGAGSSMVIRWADGSRLLLRPDSRLRAQQKVITSSAVRLPARGSVTNGGSGWALSVKRWLASWPSRPSASAPRTRKVADNPTFNPLRHDLAGLVATEQRLPLPVGSHHWRLASVQGAHDAGPWGDAQTGTRLQRPPPPAAQPPQASADGVLLDWSRSPRDGTAYRMQVARDAGFTTLLADERTAGPSWLLRQPQPGSYHVRVQAIDADGLAGVFGAAQ